MNVVAMHVYEHRYSDLRLWDARVWYRCHFCDSVDFGEYPNLTLSTVRRLRRLERKLKGNKASGVSFSVINPLDSFLRIRDDEQGCYADSRQGLYWLTYPCSSLDIQDQYMRAGKNVDSGQASTQR